MVSNNFIMHIVSATTAIISLILLMASVYYGLYEQWIYVHCCHLIGFLHPYGVSK